MAELLFLLEDLEGVAFPESDGRLTVAFPFLWSPGFLVCCVRLGMNPLQNDIISKQPNFGNELMLVFRLMSTRKRGGPGTIWPNADTSHSTMTCPVLLTRKLLTHWCICPWMPEQGSWRRTCLSKSSKRVPVWSPQQALPPGRQPGLKRSLFATAKLPSSN